jgi:hypothetical protein
MEDLGIITGLKQITRPYGLRYGAGNAFNKSSELPTPPRLRVEQKYANIVTQRM